MSVYEEASQLFRRQFTFKASSAWRPPDPNRICSDADADWCLPALQQMKTDLNATKSLLNDMEPIAWRRHTTWTNRAANVMNRVRQSAAPELLTQAWCKFFQLLHDYELADTVPLRSFHLCEAPGAFILALQHYLRSGCAEDECDRGGRRQLDLVRQHPEPVLRGERLQVDRHRRPAHLHDARPVVAASTWSPRTAAWTARTTLPSRRRLWRPCTRPRSPRPSSCSPRAVTSSLKMFTFFERSSVSLLYLLNCVFRQVHVKKPACSKPGNSEVYVVCKSFRGEALTADHVTALTNLVADRRALCVCGVEDLPADFVSQVEECAQYFKELQERTIRENIQWFQNDMDQPSCLRLQSVKDTVASLYIERYECRHVGQPPLPLMQGASAFLLRCRGWNVASFSERNGRSDWWKKHA
ncbi:hypothetical protein MTO96_020461 [Rhipicephalus appendiculatus]